MRLAEMEPPPFPVLLADIGGTNARFALLVDRDSAIQVFPPVPTADFPDIETAIAAHVLPHVAAYNARFGLAVYHAQVRAANIAKAATKTHSSGAAEAATTFAISTVFVCGAHEELLVFR